MDGNRQNADLTFKYNQSFGRHGWLRLTPAYSVRMVEQILSELTYTPECVLEPFSGTGTTGLVCANRGIPAVAYDVNPFLVWLANVKSSIYQEESVAEFSVTARRIAEGVTGASPCTFPPIYHIERWWNAGALDYLARLKTLIWTVTEPPVFDLLKVAFCRLLITLSNAAFNHVSTSFYENSADNSVFSDTDGNRLFLSICEMISRTAVLQPKVSVTVQRHNSIVLPDEISGQYDTIITSPPYPNRISYIRELRPYMYWLDYLVTADNASDLDWDTIGGTWGSATSRLATWVKQTSLLPDDLFEIAQRIRQADHKSSGLMANYVLKYFDDIAAHMESAFSSIKDGGTVHYIVGNSCFYGNVVPSETIYKSILLSVGFRHVNAVVVRKRNCKKALYEYWVSAQKTA